MRKKQFRVWDIHARTMTNNPIVFDTTKPILVVNIPNNPLSFHEGCIWMELTGKLDMRGNEIFEDDTLQWNEHSGSVIFEDSAFLFVSENEGIKVPLRDINSLEIEVTGHIHQTESDGLKNDI